MQRRLREPGRVGLALLLSLLTACAGVRGAEKAISLERANPRLGASLQLLADTATRDAAAVAKVAGDIGISLDGEYIDVIIEPTLGRVTSVDVSRIRALGGTVEATSESLIRASVPVARLIEVAEHVSGIAYIREPYKPRPLAVTSQGVSLTGATVFHDAGYTGSGIKVAIIDLGFDGLADAQAAGELLHVAYTWNYIDGSSNVETTGEVHGTGVAEIVADMAPDASLYLLLIGDEVDLANAAQYCITNGIRVINHSVGWYNTNYYDGTGDVAGVANNARDHNILWVNAAGNEAADGHWQGAFADADADGYLDFGAGSDYIDGDSRDEGARIYAPGGDTVHVYMTWNDWAASDQDYDLYLYDPSGAIVASSTGWQNGSQPPTEEIYFRVLSTGYYEIVVYNYDAPEKPEIEFFAYLDSGGDSGMEHHVASSSIGEPANSAKVLAVGAIDRSDWTTGPAEAYSSRGPSNASKYASSITRPDLCGVDGVSSYTYGSFYGTSAASPHVAGAAALLLSEDPTRTADELQTLLEGMAVDMGVTGKDNTYGSGRLSLEIGAGPDVVFRVDPAGNAYADGAFYGAGFLSGSADLAEWVRVTEAVDAGTVLELDEAEPGSYRAARSPCSELVAGVVSTQPGMVLGGFEATGSGRALLALSGIVPVKVTNEGGPIQVGDLLVSSSTLGHAMRWAGEGPCPCVLVGKALQSFTGNRGLILVLLTTH